MDGQHQYEISLKKEDLFINLSSDDVYFISKQMDKWCHILMDDSYVPVPLPQRQQPAAAVAPPAPVYQEPQVQQPVYAQPQEQVQMPQFQQAQPMPQPQPQPQMVAAQPAPQPQFQPEPVPAMAPQPAMMEAQPSQYADVHLPGQAAPMPQMQAQPVPQPQPQPMPQPEPVMPAPQHEPAFQQAAQPSIPQRPAQLDVPMPPAEQAAVQDDFEAVMDTLMKDLEEEADDDDDRLEDFPEPAASGNGASSNGYKPEPDLSLVNSLADLCDRSSAANSEDYLLLSAYYLTRVEHQEAFSLKKVNSVLVKSGLTPVNHSVLEAVLSRGHLSMVPDMTGMADVSEYMITAEGLQAATRIL